ncbi:TadE/TadG family type IV pilus assembly protein [Sphingomonas colocasiae]|uniref:Pilus assembly protein n=1 Tax=Sphingomonas colocasiae TaxID=1848973 RepID=A0ABS7PHB7_9SPHN|nr:TadE family protein [Sphingomonas colocasiae]MBY8820689.1 pilus assembly protein [Sphingomonas colocasiae]
MRSFLKSAGAFIGGLLRERRAAAYIEFAYTMPPVLVLFLGGGELANMAIVHTRLSQLAHMTADNAARVRNRIDEVDINEIFIGTRLGGSSINLMQNGRVILSEVEDNDATTNNTTDQKIIWQRCKGLKQVTSSYGTEGQVLTEAIGSGTRRIQAKPGDPVVFVEIQYDYTPVIGKYFFAARTISYSSAYLVRDRPDGTIQNGSNLSGSQKATCGTYSAT